MTKFTRYPAELMACNQVLQGKLADLQKALKERTRPISFELAIDLPDLPGNKERRISQPCPPCGPGIDTERVLAELFVALWKALHMKAAPPSKPKRRTR